MEGGGGTPSRERPSLRGRVVLSLFVTGLVLTVVVTSWIVDRQLRGPIRAWAHAVVENLATRAVGEAVRDHLAPSLGTARLSHPLYDGVGRLQGITYDTAEINRLAFDATLQIEDALARATAAPLPVPLGQILGLDVLAAAGPRLPVRLVPVGSVEATPRASFEQAGINQTLHRLSLHVTVHMAVAVPFVVEQVTVATEVPLVEQLVVGQVPLVYLEWSGDPRSLPGQGLTWGGTGEPAP